MINKPIVGVAGVDLVLAAGGVYYLRSRNPPMPTAPVAAVQPRRRNPRNRPSRIRFPQSRREAAAPDPLPSLADSECRCMMHSRNSAVRMP